MKNRSRYLTLILIIVLFVSLSFSGWIVVNLLRQSLSSSNISNYYQPKPVEIIGQQYLVAETLNFDHLSLNDLPNFRDVRTVANYNDHLIIFGLDQIIEYDPKKEEVIRKNNNLLPGVSSIAVINQSLYLSQSVSQGNFYENPNWKGRIYKIDLITGKIVENIYSEDSQRWNYNLNIVEKDGYLWIGEDDGVFRMDPKDNSLTQIGNNEEFSNPHLFVEDGKLLIDGNFEYDDGSKTWIQRSSSPDEYGKRINKGFKDFGLNLPTFFAISERINDRYYLFSDLGVYTLDRGEFPKQLISKDLDTTAWGRFLVYVTKDEIYALLIAERGFGGDGPLSGKVANIAHLFHLKDEKAYDLIGSDLKLTSQDKAIFKRLNGAFPNETENGISLISFETNKEVAKVDFKSKRLILF